jgi:hypothetical protein
VKVTPLANQSGAVTIAVTVRDGSATRTDTFVLTVNPVNDPPTISDIGNQTSDEDTPTVISLIIYDIESEPANLALIGTSSNPALVANGSIVFSGSGTNRTVTVTPQANQSGTSTITLRVTDAELTATDSFVFTVNPVNDPPTISDIADRTIYQNTSTGPINFTIGDVESSASSLVVSGDSSNPTLVPNSNIAFLGAGPDRSVTVMPAPLQTGTATIRVTVNDGDRSTNDTFVLTVNPVVATGVTTPPPAGLLPESAIRPLLGIDIEERQVFLQIKGLPTNRYVIETSADFQSWSTLGMVQSPTGVSYFEDASSRSAQRFYRVRESP